MSARGPRAVWLGVLWGLLLTAAPVRGAIPEPSAVFYGIVTVGGTAVAVGTLEVERSGDPVGSSTIASIAGEELYVLQVPVVTLATGEMGPPPGSVEIGDSIDIFLNGVETGSVLVVADRGSFVRVDLLLSGFFYQLAGSATGGLISLTVSGVGLVVPTYDGEAATTVAESLAAAINADPTLQSLGITAGASGGGFVTNGSVSAFDIQDFGLAPGVPALGTPGQLILVASLLGAMAAQRRRQKSGTAG